MQLSQILGVHDPPLISKSYRGQCRSDKIIVWSLHDNQVVHIFQPGVCRYEQVYVIVYDRCKVTGV